jgi:hypothetical protein
MLSEEVEKEPRKQPLPFHSGNDAFIFWNTFSGILLLSFFAA